MACQVRSHGHDESMSSKADQIIVSATNREQPDRKKASGRLKELVTLEKRTKKSLGKLQTKLAQKREEFGKELSSTPSESDRAAVDWEATVERAIYGEQEHESETRLKKSIQDEKNSGKLELPLQFDYTKKVFIDNQDQVSKKVPLRLADVINAWFAHDPTTPGKLRRQLSYAEIGAIFIRGRIRKTVPATAAEAEIRFREQNFFGSGNLQKNPADFATRFATDFTRWLKNNGVVGDQLFKNDKAGQRYVIVSAGWHPTRPLINRGEASKRRAASDDE